MYWLGVYRYTRTQFLLKAYYKGGLDTIIYRLCFASLHPVHTGSWKGALA